jgi:hypothetical protein
LERKNNKKKENIVRQERQGENVKEGGGYLQKKNLVMKFIYGFVVRLERVIHLQLVLLNASRHVVRCAPQTRTACQ